LPLLEVVRFPVEAEVAPARLPAALPPDFASARRVSFISASSR
jgi:hypothetical protein